VGVTVDEREAMVVLGNGGGVGDIRVGMFARQFVVGLGGKGWGVRGCDSSRVCVCSPSPHLS